MTDTADRMSLEVRDVEMPTSRRTNAQRGLSPSHLGPNLACDAPANCLTYSPRLATFNNMVERYSPGLDQTYVALANPIRRSILERLGSGAARVTDLADPFDISLAAVSKHVRMLERAGLVNRRIAGRDHWLAFNAQPLSPAGEWIERNRRFWQERLDKLGELVR